MYEVCYGSNEVICTSPTWVFFSSSVYKMEMLNKADLIASMPIMVGQVWQTQPQIQLTLADGTPVQGKKVVAFSWPEPDFNPDKGTDAFADAIKFAYLTNSISLPSDENGTATFQNLAVFTVNRKYRLWAIVIILELIYFSPLMEPLFSQQNPSQKFLRK